MFYWAHPNDIIHNYDPDLFAVKQAEMCWSHAATPRCTCTPRRCSPPAICNGERISSASSVSWSADGTAVCARGSWRRWGCWSWCDPPAWWRDWCSPHTNTRPPGCPRVYGPRRDLFCPNTFNEWVKTGLAYTLLIKSLVLVSFFLISSPKLHLFDQSKNCTIVKYCCNKKNCLCDRKYI